MCSVVFCFYLHFLAICSAHSLPTSSYTSPSSVDANCPTTLGLQLALETPPGSPPWPRRTASSSRQKQPSNEGFLFSLPAPFRNGSSSCTYACVPEPCQHCILQLLPSAARFCLLLYPDKQRNFSNRSSQVSPLNHPQPTLTQFRP